MTSPLTTILTAPPYKRFRQVVVLSILLSVASLSLLCSANLRKVALLPLVPLIPGNSNDVPPTFAALRDQERVLPQHNLTLPYPEGQTGRYVLFSNSRAQRLGWNNKLNQFLMDHWIANQANRTYVFFEYQWPDHHYPWPFYKYREWVPHTPLGAFISGPTAGGPWEDGDTTPRSISESWFDVVCPKSERHYINAGQIKRKVINAEGSQMLAVWVQVLSRSKKRCIEIVPEDGDPFPQTLDLAFWCSKLSLSVWDAFIKSPVSRLLSRSEVVASAVRRNEMLFRPTSPEAQLALTSQDPFANVLAVHLRRGDYEDHCNFLWDRNATFYNWNLLPFLPDPLIPEDMRDRDAFNRRCFSSEDHIIDVVNDARRAYLQALPLNTRQPPIDTIFMLSNGKTSWLNNLGQRLKEDHGWSKVVVSRELVYNSEGKEVGVAVDADIARQTAVFVGNGWSSMSSNIVHRRLVDGRIPMSIRFL